MASLAPPMAHRGTQPSVQALGDELLELIFLRLPTLADLARASTACPSFRRIITGRSFLRRLRKLHPRQLLGFVDSGGFRPAQAPHPSAPLARALADAADFTYSFVPNPDPMKKPWCLRDVRDGRVLIDCTNARDKSKILAVCDPLSRRYVLLPPIPRDLAIQEKQLDEMLPILVPISEDEDETSFKLICMESYATKVVAFLFSSVTRQWSMAASSSWSSLGTDRPWGYHYFSFLGCRGLSCFNYVRGCFYSASPWMDKLLVLDTRRKEFSTVNNLTGYHIQLSKLPGQAHNVLTMHSMKHRRRPGQRRSLHGIVVGREGTLEMFSLVGDHSPNGSFDLYHTTQENNGESTKEWQLENIIPLPGQYDYFTVGAAKGFLFLGGTTEDQQDANSEVWLSTTDWDVDYFALKVQTSELMKICRNRKQFIHCDNVYPYFGFPSSLSEPSI